MRIKLLTFLCIISLQFTGLSKSGILDYTITVKIKSAPIKVILSKIEEIGHVRFSYNPEFIDENKLVSLNIKNKSIEYGLSLIFDNEVRFKEVGMHIVLLKNENKDIIKAREKQEDFIVFKGKITDELTGNPISGTSVYDVDSRHAVLTDKNGNYSLTISMSEEVRSLYCSRKGYERKVLVLDTKAKSTLINNVVLKPKKINIEKLSANEVQKITETKTLASKLVPYEFYKHVENLPEINETRMAQISLIPKVSIGSNLSTNGLIINKFSLNVLAGYSKGVDGFEIGGISNIVNGDVSGAQVGGVANLTGGNVNGVQIAGITNLNQGNVNGVQISGISSVIKGDLEGFQLSGIVSIVNGSFDGVQVSGISNLVLKKSYGVQISGVYNQVFDTLVGSQISGIGNSALNGNTTNQISGIFNLTNINSGTQFSSIYNHANENNSFQIGLINTSKKSNGIALGLINYVKEGYHKTEISTSDILDANIVLKSGVQRLYNSYSFGVKFGEKPIYSGGLGLGTYFNLSKKTCLSLDLSTHATFNSKKYNSSFNRLSLTFDYTPIKWITLFVGPSFNTSFTLKSDEMVQLSNHSFFEKDYNNGILNLSIGGQLGIRF